MLMWNVIICCRIAKLKKLEEEKDLLEKVKNEIEAFVFDAQDRLEQRDYKLCSTEDERVAISAKLSEASDWLIEQDDTTPRKVVVSWFIVELFVFIRWRKSTAKLLCVELGDRSWLCHSVFNQPPRPASPTIRLWVGTMSTGGK